MQHGFHIQKQHNQTLQLMLLATLFGQLSQTGTHTGYAF